MATPGQIKKVAEHYIIAAIWADCPEGTHPRATMKSKRVAFDICKTFIDAWPLLFNAAMERSEIGYGSHPDAGSAEAAFGHDLWLSTSGHGVGFFDRDELKKNNKDWPDIGHQLQERARAFGEPQFDFYRGWFNLYPRTDK